MCINMCNHRDTMGHSREDKRESHARIVQAAARRFRERGIEGLSIAGLMQEAGLTHGGFYKHFDSRGALVKEALDCALSASAQAGTDGAGFRQRVEAYLSPAHRDAPGSGCAVAALAGDVGRADDAARARYAQQLRQSLGTLAGLLGGTEGAARAQAEVRAMVAFSAMVGALGLARACAGDPLSDEILATVRAYLGDSFAPGAEGPASPMD